MGTCSVGGFGECRSLWMVSSTKPIFLIADVFLSETLSKDYWLVFAFPPASFIYHPFHPGVYTRPTAPQLLPFFPLCSHFHWLPFSRLQISGCRVGGYLVCIEGRKRNVIKIAIAGCGRVGTARRLAAAVTHHSHDAAIDVSGHSPLLTERRFEACCLIDRKLAEQRDTSLGNLILDSVVAS